MLCWLTQQKKTYLEEIGHFFLMFYRAQDLSGQRNNRFKIIKKKKKDIIVGFLFLGKISLIKISSEATEDLNYTKLEHHAFKIELKKKYVVNCLFRIDLIKLLD